MPDLTCTPFKVVSIDLRLTCSSSVIWERWTYLVNPKMFLQHLRCQLWCGTGFRKCFPYLLLLYVWLQTTVIFNSDPKLWNSQVGQNGDMLLTTAWLLGERFISGSLQRAKGKSCNCFLSKYSEPELYDYLDTSFSELTLGETVN